MKIIKYISISGQSIAFTRELNEQAVKGYVLDKFHIIPSIHTIGGAGHMYFGILKKEIDT